MPDSPLLALASTSPRRRAFMQELGLACAAIGTDIDESPRPGEEPVALACRLAEEKAAAAVRILAGQVTPHLVIAADTVVALDGELLGKPVDPAAAVRMLTLLRARSHFVHTAISVLHTGGRQRTRVNSTRVVMRDYSDREIADYVATGDPMDKAGAYAIQHPQFRPVDHLEGCMSGVMGFPLGDLRDLLAELGFHMPCAVVDVCQRQTHFPCCQQLGAAG